MCYRRQGKHRRVSPSDLTTIRLQTIPCMRAIAAQEVTKHRNHLHLHQSLPPSARHQGHHLDPPALSLTQACGAQTVPERLINRLHPSSHYPSSNNGKQNLPYVSHSRTHHGHAQHRLLQSLHCPHHCLASSSTSWSRIQSLRQLVPVTRP